MVAGASPSVDDVGLASSLGDGMETLADGGGSMAECVVGALEGTTGSGRGAMASSEDAVSIVIWVVVFVPVRWV